MEEIDADERYSRALRAMKQFGISSNVVDPMLQKLLKVYNDWRHIEADNYTVLVNAIFDSESEEKVPEKKKKRRGSLKRKNNEVEDTVEIVDCSSSPKAFESIGGELFTIYEEKGYENFGSSPSSSKKVDKIDSDDVLLLNWHGDFEKSSSPQPLSKGIRKCKSKGSSQSKAMVVRENGEDRTIEKNFVSTPSNGVNGMANIMEHLPELSAIMEHLIPLVMKTYSKQGGIDSDHILSGSEDGYSSKGNSSFSDLQTSRKNVVKIIKLVEKCSLEFFKFLVPQHSPEKLMQDLCKNFLDSIGSKDVNGKANGLSNRSTIRENHLSISASAIPNRQNPTVEQDLVLILENGIKSEFFHDLKDISKGHEKNSIPVSNDGAEESFPPRFNYIPKNVIYQNAYVNFSFARIGDDDCCSNCHDNCLEQQITCACARETGGEYAYTSEGFLKEQFLDDALSILNDPKPHHQFYCKDCPLERIKDRFESDPCKGHLIKKFIKECWSKCICKTSCGNRVVQRGITAKLEVFFTSKEKGWGLRTLEEIPRGAFVCEYVGEIVTNLELFERNNERSGQERHTYPVLLDADWGSEGVLKDEEALCLDATNYGNVARFINHRCSDANLMEIPVEIESPDHHYYHLAFFTTRSVKPMEELTWDYGIDFEDQYHPVKAFRCVCGSDYCRDIKRHSHGRNRAF